VKPGINTGAMLWPTEYRLAVNRDHVLQPQERPTTEVKSIFQPSGHYSSSTVGNSEVDGAKEVCTVMGPKTFKPLPLHAGSPPAPQHTTTGGRGGTLQHMGHFCLLMFLFTLILKILVCCTSSEWGRVWPGYSRKDLHLQRREFT